MKSIEFPIKTISHAKQMVDLHVEAWREEGLDIRYISCDVKRGMVVFMYEPITTPEAPIDNQVKDVI